MPKKYPPKLRAEVLQFALDNSTAKASEKYGIHVNTISRWRGIASGKGRPDGRSAKRGLNGPPRPRRGTTPPENPIQTDHFDDCPMCMGTGKRSEGAQNGLYLPEGTTVDDVRVIFRVAGVEDLGVKSRGRGSGATMRQENQAQRTGRHQAKERRQEEHA